MFIFHFHGSISNIYDTCRRYLLPLLVCFLNPQAKCSTNSVGLRSATDARGLCRGRVASKTEARALNGRHVSLMFHFEVSKFGPLFQYESIWIPWDFGHIEIDLAILRPRPNEFKASGRFLDHKLSRDSRRFGLLHPGPKGPMCNWGPVCVDLLLKWKRFGGLTAVDC